MFTLFAAVLLWFGQIETRLSNADFVLYGRLWIVEKIRVPAHACFNGSRDKAKFDVKLNARGEVVVSFRSVSSPEVRRCLELVVVPTRHFSKDVLATSLSIQLPTAQPEEPGTIIDEIEPRVLREDGAKCLSHQECGAGQVCIGTVGSEASGSVERCIDLQRWLAAQN